MHPSSRTSSFVTKNLHAQCMGAWCINAFCCRHISFKTVFQGASEHAIFIQKNGNVFWTGGQPLPSPHGNRRGYPLPHVPPQRLRRSTLGRGVGPTFQNPKYATDQTQKRATLSLNTPTPTPVIHRLVSQLTKWQRHTL